MCLIRKRQEQGMRCLKDRSLLNVNDCLEGEHNAAIGVFLQALFNNMPYLLAANTIISYL